MADPVGAAKFLLKSITIVYDCYQQYKKIDDDFGKLVKELDEQRKIFADYCTAIAEDPSLTDILDLESIMKATDAVKEWSIKLKYPLPDTALVIPSLTAPSDPPFSEQMVECLPFGESVRKQATSLKSHLREMVHLAIGRGKKWGTMQANKAIFLAKGKEELNKLIVEVKKCIKNTGLRYLPRVLPPTHRIPASFDLANHKCLAYVMRARKRASSRVPIRRTIAFEQSFGNADLLSYDGCNVPIQKDGDLRRLLDRERRPDGEDLPASMRAVAASQDVVRMFQLDADEDPEEFCRSTGLLSCSALVMHKDEIDWEKDHRKEWDELLEKNPDAWKLPENNDLRPPAPRHSILFNLPKNMHDEPMTLRRRLDDDRLINQKPFLVNRIRFACALAEATIVIHSMGLVHKGIRPDNILVINEGGEEDHFTRQIGMPYLIGFEQVRGEDKETGMQSYLRFEQNELRRNVYTSSDFFENNRHRKYVMLDDIYSFGITLIEILTWQSFFKYEKEGHYPQWKRDESALDIKEDAKHRKTWTDAFSRKAEALKHISYPLVDIVQMCLHPEDAFKGKEVHGTVLGHEELTLSLESSMGIEFVKTVLTELRALETANSRRLGFSIFRGA